MTDFTAISKYVFLEEFCILVQSFALRQSSKLAGSPKSEASEIMLRTSETIFALVRLD